MTTKKPSARPERYASVQDVLSAYRELGDAAYPDVAELTGQTLKALRNAAFRYREAGWLEQAPDALRQPALHQLTAAGLAELQRLEAAQAANAAPGRAATVVVGRIVKTPAARTLMPAADVPNSIFNVAAGGWRAAAQGAQS